MGLAFIAHNVLVIGASAIWPEQTVGILPDADDYFAKQLIWIRTGIDPEYDIWVWIPSHLTLLVCVFPLSLCSLGMLTFLQGFYEVDLMNYYNGMLLRESQNGVLALALGWHVWSVLRGFGYLLLTYELTSLAIEFWTWKQLTSWRVRGARITGSLGFLLADGVAKYCLLESVRVQLAANLLS